MTTNGSVPDGCVAAHIALERATHADEKAGEALSGFRSTYEAMGSLSRDFAGIRAEMREGFRQLGARVRRAERGVDELEDTGSHELKVALAKAQNDLRWANRRLLGAVLGGIVAILAAVIVALLKGHK